MKNNNKNNYLIVLVHQDERYESIELLESSACSAYFWQLKLQYIDKYKSHKMILYSSNPELIFLYKIKYGDTVTISQAIDIITE